MSSSTLFFSLLGGVLPALFWLWFWLREDRLHPEPRALVMFSFIGGMVAVLFALPLEQWVCSYVASEVSSQCPGALGSAGSIFLVIVSWSIIEEVLKYLAAYVTALRRRDNDEPIDSLIYLITAALGFAALENTLFLAGAFTQGGFIGGVDLGILRFVGATLLHVATSGVLGFFLALGWRSARHVRRANLFLGLSTAIVLHTLFNLYILKSAGGGHGTLTVFAFVWLAIVLLLVGFEKVKQIKER